MKCLTVLMSLLAFPTLQFCDGEAPAAVQEPASGEETAATQEGEEGDAQGESGEASAALPTYTVLHEGQPLYKTAAQYGGMSPLAKGTVLTIHGSKGPYLEVKGEGELTGWIKIPRVQPGQGVDTAKYIQNSVSSHVGAGLVTKGVGDGKLKVQGVSPEDAEALAQDIQEAEFDFADFEAFAQGANLVAGFGEDAYIPQDQPDVESVPDQQIPPPLLGQFPVDTVQQLQHARALQILRDQIRTDDHFFEHNLPLEEERAIGLSVGMQLAAGRIVDDPELQRYISLIGAVLIEHTQRDDVAYRFTVIEDPTINAFAAPGGFIFITTGCIQACRNEAELAGVLAHEIAHVDLKHGLRMMDNPKNRSRVAKKMMGDVFEKPDAYAALSAAADESFNYMIQGWGKDFELEADAGGMRLLCAAGWDYTGFLRFLSEIEDHESPSVGDAYSTHPSTKQRRKHLRRLVETLGVKPNGVLLEERLRERTASLR